MKLAVVLTLVVILISLVAMPALAQDSGDTTDAQLQKKNHEDTDPFFDGNGGINRHQTIGDPGPNGADYGNYDGPRKDDGFIQQLWVAVNRWLIVLSALH